MRVIENCDDAVTKETAGWYWCEDNGRLYAAFIAAGERFYSHQRYIRIDPPDFPPRRPPKPEIEWRWVRYCGNEQWAYQSGSGGWIGSNGLYLHSVTVLD